MHPLKVLRMEKKAVWARTTEDSAANPLEGLLGGLTGSGGAEGTEGATGATSGLSDLVVSPLCPASAMRH